MPRLGHFWLGTITDGSRFAGTDSSVVLIISGGRDRADRLHHTFPDTSQSDFEGNQANIYEVNEDQIEDAFVPGRIDTDELTTESIRLGIRGDDTWKPQAVFVWGREQRDEGQVVPLGLVTSLRAGISIGGTLANVDLSTDADEGAISFRVPQVTPGGPAMIIRTLIVAMITADEDDAGTDDLLNLKITTADGRVVLDRDLTDTKQSDQEQGEANIYFVPVDTPFSKSELFERSIVLSIRGNDAWLPTSFFVFGFQEALPEAFPPLVEPLVQITTWPFGTMSTDPTEGRVSAVLPLLPSPPPVIL
jgi:hypothetical protein